MQRNLAFNDLDQRPPGLTPVSGDGVSNHKSYWLQRYINQLTDLFVYILSGEGSGN
jgi:hypothetical protein